MIINPKKTEQALHQLLNLFLDINSTSMETNEKNVEKNTDEMCTLCMAGVKLINTLLTSNQQILKDNMALSALQRQNKDSK